MVGRSKKREDVSTNRDRVRQDKDVIVHRRQTSEPFVSEFSVRKGVSTLEILRGNRESGEGHKRSEGK